ncbi:MAG: hypothetical protein KAI79_13365, partial [Bacteroidales bacterium]|nr:hypothetical protein [Bacteroidales bacterium]
MLDKIFNKLGYTKLAYRQSSDDRAFAYKGKLKEANIEITNLQIKNKNLKTEVNKFEKVSVKFSPAKLQAWAKKVKTPKCCDTCRDVGVPLQAHHLWAKSCHPTLAYEKRNGVALCLTCHEGYHKKYPRT